MFLTTYEGNLVNKNNAHPPSALLAQLTAWPLIAPVTIQPSPTPTQMAVTKMRLGKESMIVLQFVTPSGVQTYFMEEGAAAQLENAIREHRTGLVVPQIGPT